MYAPIVANHAHSTIIMGIMTLATILHVFVKSSMKPCVPGTAKPADMRIRSNPSSKYYISFTVPGVGTGI